VPLPGGTTPTPTIPIGRNGRPDINPYERDIDLTVPLLYRERSLGELPVRLSFDDQFFVSTEGFVRLIRPLLNSDAQRALEVRLAGRSTFSSADLAQTGVSLDYDPGTLSVVLLRIDPSQRTVESVFGAENLQDEAPDQEPANFSAYVNLNVLQSYLWEGGSPGPILSFSGAGRFGTFVFEGDGFFGEQSLFGGSEGYKLERNFARLVYDEPAAYRRWFAGDLVPETRGQQGFVRMGGIGVIRQRRTFNELRSSALLGNRQLVLQRDSTVRILRNGVPFREIRLEAGSYDFSTLPLLSGSNDIQIQVRDDSGGVQNIGYQQYLDPIDLVPGDYEYGIYAGPISRSFGRSPTYDGPVALTAFYRKAPLNRRAFGVGVQLSKDVQNVTGQTQFILGNGARLLVDGAASHSNVSGVGGSVGVAYDQLIDRGKSIDSFSIAANYLTQGYAFLGTADANNLTRFTLNGQYNRTFSERLSAFINATYLASREANRNSYRFGAGVNYRVSRRWAVRAGADYTRLPNEFRGAGGFGATAALIYQPSFRDRAELRHDSSLESTTLSYSHSGPNRLNSASYGALLTHDPDQVSASLFADYIGNRFDASLSHATFGDDFGGLGGANVTTLRVGTSLAFAGGAFAIGRRINDSFAILYPHRTLRGRSIVAGQSLARNEYTSQSGPLGGALNNFLTSYVTQSVQYDVEDPPTGYDIGAGVVRVRPPYRSGYAIRVGTEAFVSASGTLLLADGKPVALAGGRVIPIDGTGEPLPFFTNSIGRFAIVNLRPDMRYRVEVYGSGATFEFLVPADTTGLVNLGTVRPGAK
jgi:outer membrane usher protein